MHITLPAGTKPSKTQDSLTGLVLTVTFPVTMDTRFEDYTANANATEGSGDLSVMEFALVDP